MSNPSLHLDQETLQFPSGIQYHEAFDTLVLQDWPEQLVPGASTPQLYLAASDGVSLDAPQPQYRLGESWLPIAPYRAHIVDTVRDNQKSIITAETGSGKSTQLGLHLLEAGAPVVYITQPRILAARELLHRARQSLGPEYGHLAGYLTGDQDDSDCPEGARLVYVTEDLLFKMANRGTLSRDAVVIVDEAHERTAGTIMLLGLMKELCEDNANMRLVVSSATIDEQKFSNYLDSAPVVKVPGRTFPIEDRETSETVAEAMRRHMKRPNEKNVLAFEPGASRLKRTWVKASSRLHDHTVHQLYGDQSPREQKAALNPDDKNHIVSTKIGETSITPENKDIVVDSGLSNLGGYEAGKRTLTTVFSSKATMKQRRGRVGRTKPGIYEIATPEDAPPVPFYKSRPDYDPPEIENSSVASYLLELASQGRRIEDLDLLESPTDENLRHDKVLLRRLGAAALFTEDILVPTDIGLALINLNLDPSEARMLVEARKYTTGEDGSGTDVVRLQVAAAVAVQQVHGILDVRPGTRQKYRSSNRHQDALSIEQTSDVLFQLDVFTQLLAKQQELFARDPANAEEYFEQFLAKRDILPNRYYKAFRTYKELCRREDIEASQLRLATAAERRNIVACQITGANELFLQRGKQSYTDIRGERGRQLGTRSTVNPALGSLVVGTAFDYRGLRRTGRFGKRLIASASAVTVDQLLMHAPDRITRQRTGYGISKNGDFVEKQALYFDGEMQFAEMESQELTPTEDTRRALLVAMMTGQGQSIQNGRQKIAYSPGTPRAEQAIIALKRAHAFGHLTKSDLRVTQNYNRLIEKVIQKSLQDIPLEITDPAQLDSMIPSIFPTRLIRPSRKRQAIRTAKVSPSSILLTAEHDITNNLAEHMPSEMQKQPIEVTYRNGIAHVTIPRDLKFTIKRSDFEGLAAHHDIKVRTGSEKYQQFDVAFKLIDEQRPEHERKRQERTARRAEKVSAEARGRVRRATADRRRKDIETAKIINLTERLADRQTSHRKRSRYLKSLARANGMITNID